MKKKIDSLQVVRVLAFLGILLCHSSITEYEAGGIWGVSVFLILSGFLMYYSYYDTDRVNEHGIKDSFIFGVKKIRKLYPLHIVTMLLAVPYLISNAKELSGIGRVLNPLGKLLANIFLVQAWVPDSGVYFSLNGVAWYLSVALFLYIMFPFLLSRMRKYKGISTAIKVIVITFIMQVALAVCIYFLQENFIQKESFIHWFTYVFPISRIEDFIIGCNLGYIFAHAKKDKDINKKFSTFLELGILVVIVIQWILYYYFVAIPSRTDYSVINSVDWWRTAVMWTPTACVMVYLFALNRGLVSKILTNKVVLFIGKHSANAFLIHQMVYRYFETFEKKVLGDIDKYRYINIFACLIVTIICSIVWEKITMAIRNKKNA